MEKSSIQSPLGQNEQPCTKEEMSPTQDAEIDREVENIIVEHLNDMIVRRIKLETRTKEGHSTKPRRLTLSSFKLLHDCCHPLNADMPQINSPLKSKKKSNSLVDYTARASECSVDTDWVRSTHNTKFWRDPKKTRLTCVTPVRLWPNGRVECEIIK